MPLIFGLLVIINAVFLAWQFYERQNSGPEYSVQEPIPGQKLQLVGESQASAATANEGEVAAGEVSSSSSKVSCYRIGPILDNSSLERLRSALVSNGFEVKTESFSQSSSGYVVYIPPQASREKALSMVTELQARGLSAKVADDPQYADSVTVGVYTSRDQALDMNNRLAQMGYSSEVRETSSGRQEQWLKVESAGTTVKSQIDRIISGTPHLRREPASCET